MPIPRRKQLHLPLQLFILPDQLPLEPGDAGRPGALGLVTLDRVVLYPRRRWVRLPRAPRSRGTSVPPRDFHPGPL